MNAVYSELHSRLNHMVNYSSQLIFVSSNTIAEQQRTLELFLAEQSEQTEIAFITAHPNTEVRQYRRQLCQQLLGQVAGTFVRPLNELLESLNHHEGPILVGIMQAQELPNDFLQELWQLVLQSRFAANKQHLNIILFGQSDWAEQAQTWLPAKNTATPLLLSSETVSTQMSELDTLIAQKRAAFHQRLALRNQQSSPVAENGKPLLRNPWFNLAMIGCFVVFFVAILWTQYPAKMKALIGVEAPPEEPGVTIPQSPSVSSYTAEEAVAATVLETAQKSHPEDKLEGSVEPRVEPQTEASPESITEQLLVGNWASTTTESATQPTTATTQQQLNPVPDGLDAPRLELAESDQDLVLENATSSEGGGELLTAISSSAEPVYAATAVSMIELPDNSYVIQLAGVSSDALANQFIADNQLADVTLRYQTLLNGNEWHVILYSQTFTSIEAARQAIADLPNYARQSEPFVKSSRQIMREIARQ